MMFCRRLLVLGGVVTAMAGCVASGPIKGRLTEPGKPPVPLTMHYRSERFGENGTMTATLPDGESFSGRYLQVSSETSGDTLAPFWGGYGVAWDDWGADSESEAWITGSDLPTFIQNYSGKVIATLLGDRNGRMRCRFRLANPAEGMSGGGVGMCQVAGGGKIDAEF
jgi:hypothetical protein